MPSEYSLSDVLERMYQNQLALEAALMELTVHAETKGNADVGDNVRGRFTQLVRTLATSNKVWHASRSHHDYVLQFFHIHRRTVKSAPFNLHSPHSPSRAFLPAIMLRVN